MTLDSRTPVVKVAVIKIERMHMETVYANEILQRMARERGVTVAAVIQEYLEHQINGRVQHFWPDQNEACRYMLENGL